MKATNLQEIFKVAPTPFSPEDQKFLKTVFEFADKAHHGQIRKSGEPYINHSLHVARILSEIGMDEKTIASGLLHDVPEDTSVTLEDVRAAFGEEVAYLVDGVTKLGKIKLRGSKEEVYLENLRKMFLAMAQDIRVVIIKLADRLHNMRTLNHLPPEKQQRIARETMDIYAPIANRLGIGEMKVELEDICFQYLYPEQYQEVVNIEETYLHAGKTYMTMIVDLFKNQLAEAKIQVCDIHGRTKGLYRLYQKLLKHDMDINRVYDLLAIRIIVPEIADCYEALGIIHREYRPMVGRIKDYISLPKPNGYQSLHTTIFGPEGRIIEVQIRTQKMHDESEYGIAAHWMYTEREKPSWRNIFSRNRGKETEKKAPRELAWVNQLKDWQHDIGRDDQEFLEGLKIEFFKNHIFAFTPKGDVIELPEEATPIDFGFAIHSEVGARAVGAKANGKMVPLDYHIQNGEVIEILTVKESKKPSRDWLKSVKTSRAKQHIRVDLRDDEFKK
jgi:GTP diphosphokinase / guanosine-3',5'-bis(diphosphate) 3'-diphosphatase